MQTARRGTRTHPGHAGAREGGRTGDTLLGSGSLNTRAPGSTTGPRGQMGFYTLSCPWATGGRGAVSQEPSARKTQPERSGGQVATGPKEGAWQGRWAGPVGAGGRGLSGAVGGAWQGLGRWTPWPCPFSRGVGQG